LKRALAAAEASRETRFNSALAKLRAEFDMSRIGAIASNVLAVADAIEQDSLRMQLILDHLGLPDAGFKDCDRGE
jgi:hypothetical protein